MTHDFLRKLEQGVVVADGAMGSLLLERSTSTVRCVDRLNLEQPELVSQVHGEYLQAGAGFIETNTFGANRFKLQALDLAREVEAINRAGAGLALEAASGAKGAGKIWVAGSMGPPGRLDHEDESRLAEVYADQAGLLARAGVDVLILETFADLNRLLEAIRGVKGDGAAAGLPLVAQMVVADSGRSFDGMAPGQCLELLRQAGADVVGINCGAGPKGARAALAGMDAVSGPLSAFPNAGLPERVADRLVYSTSTDYFARSVAELLSFGVRLVGGCCGTGPDHIRALAQEVARLEQRGVETARPPSTVSAAPGPDRTPPRTERRITGRDRFAQQLGNRRMVLVEVDPPKHLDVTATLEGAERLVRAGVDALTIAENPLGTPRFSNIALATLLRERVETSIIVHITGRDRNSVGMQSTLMGLAGLGITNVLAITGDPPPRGADERVTGVFDLRSFELIEMLSCFRKGENRQGQDLRRAVDFRIGAAFNPNTRNPDMQVGRMQRKMACGAEYFLTQPVYSREVVDSVARIAEEMAVPIFLGIMPLASHRNAEFLHNEFPGIRIPDQARERMRLAGDKGAEAGIDMAWELMEYAWPRFAGLYLIPPFGRLGVAEELIRRLRGLPAG